ncbi:MAG: tetratricopeptide repeat protein [Treponema sp.]|jgi:predicted Zn-dependent protease|nr:tetratricopeptide repeat protein [Treponema sp.]
MESKLRFMWYLSGTLILGTCAFGCAPKVEEDTLLRYVRAEAIYAQGRFSELIPLLAGEKSFPPALTLRGKAEYFSGDPEAAERSFRRALSRRPSSVEAALYLARILREKGEAGEAEALVEGILADDPGDIRALRMRAELYRDRGSAGEESAAALLDRAVEASGEAALVFVDRARFRWVGGTRTGALRDLQSAKTLLPGDSALYRGIETLESVIREASP